MRAELDKKLYEKYPAIFRQKDLPPQQTSMCWGIACDDGWYKILDTLCGWLTTMEEFTGAQVEATQVKEKFGGLRFYFTVRNCRVNDMFFPVIKEMIRFAELYSEEICEVCGQSGELSLKGGWRKTLCEEHRDELGYIKYKG
jgi:hypothetical protein